MNPCEYSLNAVNIFWGGEALLPIRWVSERQLGKQPTTWFVLFVFHFDCPIFWDLRWFAGAKGSLSPLPRSTGVLERGGAGSAMHRLCTPATTLLPMYHQETLTQRNMQGMLMAALLEIAAKWETTQMSVNRRMERRVDYYTAVNTDDQAYLLTSLLGYNSHTIKFTLWSVPRSGF